MGKVQEADETLNTSIAVDSSRQLQRDRNKAINLHNKSQQILLKAAGQSKPTNSTIQ